MRPELIEFLLYLWSIVFFGLLIETVVSRRFSLWKKILVACLVLGYSFVLGSQSTFLLFLSTFVFLAVFGLVERVLENRRLRRANEQVLNQEQTRGSLFLFVAFSGLFLGLAIIAPFYFSFGSPGDFYLRHLLHGGEMLIGIGFFLALTFSLLRWATSRTEWNKQRIALLLGTFIASWVMIEVVRTTFWRHQPNWVAPILAAFGLLIWVRFDLGRDTLQLKRTRMTIWAIVAVASIPPICLGAQVGSYFASARLNRADIKQQSIEEIKQGIEGPMTPEQMLEYLDLAMKLMRSGDPSEAVLGRGIFSRLVVRQGELLVSSDPQLRSEFERRLELASETLDWEKELRRGPALWFSFPSDKTGQYYTLVRHVIGTWDSHEATKEYFFGSVNRVVAIVELAKCRIACREFLELEQRLPRSNAELSEVTKFQVPRDPFSPEGQAIQFRFVNDREVMFYSIGENQVDDGGQLATEAHTVESYHHVHTVWDGDIVMKYLSDF